MFPNAKVQLRAAVLPRQFISSRQFAHHHPGEIVTAVVRTPLQDPNSKWKARPAILISRDGARWLVMGLTTLSHFADGTPRRGVPNPQSCGLGARESFFWGRPSWICVLDIGDHIGNADIELLKTLRAMNVEIVMPKAH